MTKWEYCSIDRYDNCLVFYKTNGVVRTRIEMEQGNGDSDEEQACGRAIAELGLNGWELVSTPWREIYGSILYFKRPLA